VRFRSGKGGLFAMERPNESRVGSKKKGSFFLLFPEQNCGKVGVFFFFFFFFFGRAIFCY